jgi:preprotein translocase subunit SecG
MYVFLATFFCAIFLVLNSVAKQTGKKNFRQLKIKLPTGQGAKTISIEGTAKSQQVDYSSL